MAVKTLIHYQACVFNYALTEISPHWVWRREVEQHSNIHWGDSEKRSRRGTNTILMKPCDSPLIVGQQTETRPSSECVGGVGAERKEGKIDKKQWNTGGMRAHGAGRQGGADNSVSTAGSSFSGSLVVVFEWRMKPVNYGGNFNAATEIQNHPPPPWLLNALRCHIHAVGGSVMEFLFFQPTHSVAAGLGPVAEGNHDSCLVKAINYHRPQCLSSDKAGKLLYVKRGHRSS